MSRDLLKLEPLEADWYARSTLDVAHELLGKILFVKTKQGLTAGRIVETEAYRSDDPASHSSRGKTPRASIMFGDPGVAYVYFIYGMYEMLNFVTEPHGDAGAVLIRGVEPVLGEELMKKRRKTARTAHDLTGGPGKLCRAMGIEMKHNGASLLGPEIWVAAPDQSASDLRTEKVRVSPRIGISEGQDRLWRFYLAENKFVSRSPMNQRSKPFRSR
jgi:DNA-3-methyladenine glycosylase